MTSLLLSTVQQRRRDRADSDVLLAIGSLVDELCDTLELDVAVPNYTLVGPDKRKKLAGLINHYRKLPHPFTACVNDNTKRFGNKAKQVCAVLTDLEKGTTHWRKGGKKKSSLSIEELADSDTTPVIDAEMFELLAAIAQTDYAYILQLDVPDGEKLAVVNAKKRAALKPSDFALPKQKKYPIHDRAHGANALARVAGKTIEPVVKAAVCKRYSDLPACQETS